MTTTSILAAPDRHRRAIDPDPESSRPGERRAVDRTAVARATRDLLIALGADLDSDGLRETPRRMAAAYLSADGIERLWEVAAPLLDRPPKPLPYAAGSWGPGAIDQLVAPHHWHLPYH
jgi:glucose-6-phosphate 1-dehydrogenase